MATLNLGVVTFVAAHGGFVLSVRAFGEWNRVAYQWPLGFHASRA